MKIEQIAFTTKHPLVLIEWLKKCFDMKEWSHDVVTAEGIVLGVPETNVAHLYFNYDLGFEFEILRYIEGDNWLNYRQEAKFGFPFLSHMGMHCTEEEAQEWIDKMQTARIGIAQEVWTKKHTNPVIAGKRKYHYIVFDSRHVLGFDLKLIVRMEGEDGSNSDS